MGFPTPGLAGCWLQTMPWGWKIMHASFPEQTEQRPCRGLWAVPPQFPLLAVTEQAATGGEHRGSKKVPVQVGRAPTDLPPSPNKLYNLGGSGEGLLADQFPARGWPCPGTVLDLQALNSVWKGFKSQSEWGEKQVFFFSGREKKQARTLAPRDRIRVWTAGLTGTAVEEVKAHIQVDPVNSPGTHQGVVHMASQFLGFYMFPVFQLCGAKFCLWTSGSEEPCP